MYASRRPPSASFATTSASSAAGGFGTSFFNSFDRMPWDFETMMKMNNITSDVQQHIVRVYATLSACLLASLVGIASSFAYGIERLYVDMFNGWFGALMLVITMGSTIWFTMEPVANFKKRFGLLMVLSVSLGINLSTLIAVGIQLDPSIVIMAFLMTTTVFVCFTGAALLAKRREYLYIGGFLSSGLSMLLWMNLLNSFFRSTAMYSVHLYGGLFLFCGYVIFDTQMMIEKASLGQKDFLAHALELFLDFVSIFTRILVILIKNADKEKADKKQR